MYNGGYNFTTDSITTTGSSDFWSNLGALSAGLIVLVVIAGLFALAIAVFLIIAECKVYKKAGEAWWKALIPVYSTWVETKITGLAWWWCPIILGITALVSFENLSYVVGGALLVVAFNYNYNLSKKFGKSNGFAVLLTLLPIVGIPMLAFGSDKYQADAKTDKNGIFAVEKDLVK